MSLQAAPASSERLVTDLERLKELQRQFMLSSTLEVQRTTRVFAHMHLSLNILPQTGRTHLKAGAFKRLVPQNETKVAKRK